MSLDEREPYNQVLEASIGYASACAIATMDEVAHVNERFDERMDDTEREVVTLRNRVAESKGELTELCQWHRELSEAWDRDQER